jgi:hypothetical protein
LSSLVGWEIFELRVHYESSKILKKRARKQVEDV